MTMRPREERGLLNHERRLDELEEAVRRLMQALPGLYQGAGGGNDSGGGGAYYADPGSTIVASLDSAELDVMEARADGDRVVGTKTVLNYYSSDTLADLRLILAKCSDGSYLIVGQDCPAPGGG